MKVVRELIYFNRLLHNNCLKSFMGKDLRGYNGALLFTVGM